MKTGLIGHTGFVGSNLSEQKIFSEYFNSSNIEKIKNQTFDLLICAGLSGKKYLINRNPDVDLLNLNNQKNLLKTVQANKIIFISTIDVYDKKIDVNEKSIIDNQKLDNYSKNRYDFENFLKNQFDNYHIIRLPMLFGRGLKKNVLYDLQHNQFLQNINKNSIFQWYCLNNLFNDINYIIKEKIKLINLISEPIKINEMIMRYFKYKSFDNNKNLIQTNIKSLHAPINSQCGNYIYSKKQILKDMDNYFLLVD